ncbi:hypothetical protein BaRGS_00036060, partial [Batillaria attramentaria]
VTQPKQARKQVTFTGAKVQAGLYITNRRLRIEVKRERPTRPHSVAATTDMDISGVSSPTHVLTTPFQSRPHTPPSSWGSTPSSPVGGGGEGGVLDGFESLSPRPGHPPGHSRLPSTDSGIQADAGWDSLTRSYNKTFSKSGMTSPSVSTASNVRTLSIEVLGHNSPREGGEGEGIVRQTNAGIGSSVSGGRVLSPTSTGTHLSYIHTPPPHSRPGETASAERVIVSPERPSNDRAMSSSFTSSSTARVMSPDRPSNDRAMSSSFTSSSVRVMSPERKAGPLNLVSSSTPVIPSRSAHDIASPQHYGDWVVGGRNNFPPHSRTRLAQAEFSSVSGRENRSPNIGPDVGSSGHVYRGMYHQNVSPPRLAQHPHYFDQGSPRHPHSQGHSQGNIVTQHYRPRVNPVPTRFVTPRVQVPSGLRPGTYSDLGSGRAGAFYSHRPAVVSVPISYGSTGPSSQGFKASISQGMKELSHHEAIVSTSSGVTTTSSVARGPTSVTSSISRSKMSPTLLRDSLRGKVPTSLSPTGVVHNIPIKHVDTCSACLKTPSAGPETISVCTGLQTAGSAQPSAALSKDSVTSGVSPSGAGPQGGSQPQDGVLKLKEGSHEPGQVGQRNVPILDLRKEVPWKERRSRIDSALSWLRNELESLRAMDTALMTQFRRCQDTIESLKQQRDAAWDNDWWWGADGKFERKWAENPDAKELEIKLTPAATATSKKEVVPEDSNLSPPSKNRSCRTPPSPVMQDVEATL